jgi:hypothetical protein
LPGARELVGDLPGPGPMRLRSPRQPRTVAPEAFGQGVTGGGDPAAALEDPPHMVWPVRLATRSRAKALPGEALPRQNIILA